MKIIKKTVVLFLSFLLLCNTISVNTTNRENNQKFLADTTAITQSLNILEVEPGNLYNLTNSTFKASGHTVKLTQMPMSEFIGRIEQLNGQYDIIYIGNKGNSYTAKGTQPTITGEGVPNASTEIDNGKANVDQEYYSDNDITNKKASEINTFIKNSGQLVIFASSIFNNAILSGSKLWSNFQTYYKTPRNNTKFFNDSSDITATNIINDYNGCSKRPSVAIDQSSSPIRYKYSPNSDGTQSNPDPDRNLNFVYNATSVNNSTDTLTTSLYLDVNGDGLFDETTEKVETLSRRQSGSSSSISYQLPDTFVGLLPWKLEVTDDQTGSEYYQTGYTLFSGTTAAIRVLQVYPNSGNTLDLTTGLRDTKLSQNGYYNLSITKEDYNSFYNDCKRSLANPDSLLNGKYDMIIFGFADNYGNQDIDPTYVVPVLQSFIKTGQSVMFTHDTTSYHIHDLAGDGTTYKNQQKSAKDYDGFGLDTTMRDELGMSRFVDPYNTSEMDLEGNLITHDSYPGGNGTVSYGFTTGATIRKDKLNGKVVTYNQAQQINDGYYTRYPYDLSDNGSTSTSYPTLGQNLSISTTHSQYFQLNLEDPKVIPWYTLAGPSSDTTGNDPGNSNDPRNYYYAYSRGNITYSGTGHSSPANSPDEHKLFVNTMVKAATSANHAPILSVNNLKDGENVSRSQSSFNFDFSATDIDLKDAAHNALKWIITVNGKQINQSGGIINATTPMTTGDDIAVSIDKTTLSTLANGATSIPVTIEVDDTQGAKATQNYTLNYGDAPTLVAGVIDKATGNVPGGYLRGDNPTIKLNVTSSDLSNSIKFSGDVINSGAVISTPSTWNLSNSVLSSSNQNVTNNFNLDLTGATIGSNQISHMFSYSDSKGFSTQQEYDYNVNIKSAAIYLKTFNNDCTTNSDGSINTDGTIFTEPVTAKVTAPDGTTFNVTTDSTGNLALLNNPNTGKPLSSGTYTINFNRVSGHSMIDNATQTVNLSYSNSTPAVSMRFTALNPPTITATTTDWTNQNVTLTLTPPSSFASSVQKMQYQIAEGQWIDYDTNNTSNTSNNKVTTEGQQNVIARTVEKSNNQNFSVNSAPVTVKIDKTGPAVVITDVTPDTNGNSIKETKGPVKLHLSATDAGIGTVNTTVTVTKASDQNWSDTITLSAANANQEYVSATDYSVNSNDTYTFTATDGLGNVSKPTKVINNLVSLTLNGSADTTNNKVDLNWNIPGVSQDYGYDVYRKATSDSNYSKLTTTDSTNYSDVNGKDLNAPTSPILASSDVTLNGTTANISFTHSTDVGSTYQYYVESKGKADDYVIDSNTVPITNTSGVRGYYISIDNSSSGNPSTTRLFNTPSASLDDSQYGKDFYVHVASVDNAGNTSDPKTYHYDKVPPTIPNITITGVGQTIYTNSSANGSVNFALGGSIDTSLPIIYQYSWDQINWTTVGEGTLTPVNDDGQYTMYARAEDEAENFSLLSHKSFLIDKTKPTAPAITTNIPAINTNNGVLWTNNENSTFNVSGSNDSGSGVKGYEYEMLLKTDSVSDTKWSDPATTVSDVSISSAYVNDNSNGNTSEGIYTVYARAADNVDNLSDNCHLDVGLDTTPPPQPNITPYDNSNSGKVNIDYGIDARSGIRTKQYRILNNDKTVAVDWTSYDGTTGVTVPTDDTIEAKSIDYAGNTSPVGVNYSFIGFSDRYIVPEKDSIHFTVNISAGDIIAPNTITANATWSNNLIEVSSDGGATYHSSAEGITGIINGKILYVKALDGSDGQSDTLVFRSPNLASASVTLNVKNTMVH